MKKFFMLGYPEHDPLLCAHTGLRQRKSRQCDICFQIQRGYRAGRAVQFRDHFISSIRRGTACDRCGLCIGQVHQHRC